MSNTTDDILHRLPAISLQINRIVPIIQLIFGTFGSVFNIVIFTRRSLRSNPCSHYFLASSINDMFALYVALLTRLLSSGWKIDPSISHNALCKLRIFLTYTSLCLTQWFVVLASADRFFSSSHTVRYRQLSSVSIARKTIAITALIVAMAYLHTFIWWRSGYLGSILSCNVFENVYEIAFEILFLIGTCTLPLVLMTIFGVLTILNVKKLPSRVTPTVNNARNERLRSKDRQMVTMLLVQVMITLLLSVPFAIMNIYDTAVENINRSSYAITINSFFDNVTRVIFYFNPVVGFYIYTLSGRTFRVEMKHIIHEGTAWILTKFDMDRYVPGDRQELNRIGSTNMPMTIVSTARNPDQLAQKM